MGAETKTEITVEGRTYRGTLQYESSFVLFRGEGYRLKIPLEDPGIWSVMDGELRARLASGAVSFALGPEAEKWLARIRNPKSRLDKLGVKADHAVAVMGEADADFLSELAGRLNHPPSRRLKQNLDLVFLFALTPAGLESLERVRGKIQPGGAIWILYPKGRKTITQEGVMRAAKAAGLVDVKVAAFSSTLTAMKTVIPLAGRAKLH